MKSIYFENDDTLQIRVSDKSITREVSQDWHTNISYAEDRSIVEIVLLDAKKQGLMLEVLGRRLNSAHTRKLLFLAVSGYLTRARARFN